MTRSLLRCSSFTQCCSSPAELQKELKRRRPRVTGRLVDAGVSPASKTSSRYGCHYSFLTAFARTDSFDSWKVARDENRGVDRILRRLKLHAEGRQFGG